MVVLKILEKLTIIYFYSILWKQANDPVRRLPIYSRILGLGRYSAHRPASKTYLYECCETPEDWRNYLNRIFGELHNEFGDYFRQREEAAGKVPELLVWNSIEFQLDYAQRHVGNFDWEYHRLKPAIKAWEQRNGVSFYSDWNWEDLLGKERVTWEEAFPPSETNSSVSANPNLNNQSHHIPRFTNYDNNPRSKSRQSNSTIINSNSPLPQPHNYQPTVYPPVKPPKTNKSDYSGGVGIFGVILVFLLVALATVILTKRKRVK